MGQFKVNAVKRGTFVSPTRGTIHHFDPEGSDPAARQPTIDEGDLVAALDAGFIAQKGSRPKEVKPQDAPELPDDVLEGLASAARIDEKAGVVASPAAAIAQTAYPPSMNVGGPESGLQADDPDAPPGAPEPSPPRARSEPRHSGAGSRQRSGGGRGGHGGRKAAAKPAGDGSGGGGEGS